MEDFEIIGQDMREMLKLRRNGDTGHHLLDVNSDKMSYLGAIIILKRQHRVRRYAMKTQQKLDRALESYVRVNETNWKPELSEKEREEFNREVKKIITEARKGKGDPLIVLLVKNTDEGRKRFDSMRDDAELVMEKVAERLPVVPWVVSVRGAGLLGLATIVAECGDLSDYSGPAKVWKRLGYAPYDGHAGSTWKRDTWRPRTLSAEEWIENPFNCEKYALIHQISVWLVNCQLIGAKKTKSGKAEPRGPYGKIYLDRRANTAITHPDWTDKHSYMDGVRIAMKAFLKDLWVEWRKTEALHKGLDKLKKIV
jgi:hypothetical protein